MKRLRKSRFGSRDRPLQKDALTGAATPAKDVRTPVERPVFRGPLYGRSVETHAALLGDLPLQRVQKQSLARWIGHMGGNRHMQRVVAAMQSGDRAADGTAAHVRVRDDRAVPPLPARRDALKRDEAAEREALSEGHHLRRAIEARQDVGHPMDPKTLAESESAFGHDFHSVRIHDDAASGELATRFRAKAFATGKDVYFARGVYRPHTEAGARALGHELTHIAEGHTANKVAFWGGSTHKQLTKVAGAKELPRGYAKLRMDLEYYCKSLDRKPGRLLYLPAYALRRLGVPTRIAPEGPKHGEDGNYTTKDVGAAAGMNKKLQKKRLDRAIKYWNKAMRHFYRWKKERHIPFHTLLVRMSSLKGKAANQLGDALHIAQDRGSHGEGVLGKGHSVPFPNDLKCDDPKENPTGYREALKNSQEVLNEFYVSVP